MMIQDLKCAVDEFLGLQWLISIPEGNIISSSRGSRTLPSSHFLRNPESIFQLIPSLERNYFDNFVSRVASKELHAITFCAQFGEAGGDIDAVPAEIRGKMQSSPANREALRVSQRDSSFAIGAETSSDAGKRRVLQRTSSAESARLFNPVGGPPGKSAVNSDVHAEITIQCFDFAPSVGLISAHLLNKFDMLQGSKGIDIHTAFSAQQIPPHTIETSPVTKELLDLADLGAFRLAGIENWVTWCSELASKKFGIAVGSTLPSRFADKEDARKFQDNLAEMDQSERSTCHFEVQLGPSDVTHKQWAAIHVTRTQSKDSPLELTCVIQDISVCKNTKLTLRRALEASKPIIASNESRQLEASNELETLVQDMGMLVDCYRQVFDTLVDPCLVLSPQNTVLDCNLACLATVRSADKGEIIGKRVDEIAPEGSVVGPKAFLGEGKDDMALSNQDGTFTDIVAETVPLRLHHLDNARLSIWHDVSERKATENRLRSERDKAERASQSKTDFLANMSHEIRTPMNGVIALTDLLLQSPGGHLSSQGRQTSLPSDIRESLQIIKSCADSLVRIVSDVLDLSKIHSNSLTVEKVSFAIREGVKAAMDLQSVTAMGKKIQLLSSFSPDVPETVVGDPARLRQVLLNLVSNAIKFTPTKGKVSLMVRLASHAELAEARSENPGDSLTAAPASKMLGLHFAVSDNGDGIRDDVLGKLFQPFVQGDTSTSRRHGGTGLGLSISKSLVSLMGGKIGVTSELGVGSTFYFTLPFSLPTERLKPSISVDVSSRVRDSGSLCSPPSGNFRERLKQLKILVAEDDKVNQLVANRMLTAMGVKCDIVGNGLEALNACKEKEYDLVLMDCHMPEMDGFEATREIRALEPSNHDRKRPLIVALTASALSHEKKKCQVVGMDDFLTKPIRPKDLELFLELHFVKGRTKE